MPIISSQVIEDSVQHDGRRWIRERHIDQLGLFYERVYMVESNVIIANGFPAIVALLNNQLIDTEIEMNFKRIYASGDLAVVSIQYATLADIQAALRAAYKTIVREQAFALGAFFNTLTNTQLGTLFGVSGGALSSLRTRLTTKASQWAEYIAAVGE